MNILILIRSIGKGIGGVEVVSISLANKFIQEGHNTSIFVFTKGEVNITERLDKNVKLFVGYGYKNSKDNIEYLREILINNKINIIINQWGLPYLPIKVINKARKDLDIKVISIFHNDPCSNGRLKEVESAITYTLNPIKRILLEFKWSVFKFITSNSMKYVYNKSDKYLVLSPCYIEHFKRFTKIKNPYKLWVQTNPVTIEAGGYVYNANIKQKEIIYVGRIDYNQKRVSRIIDTWYLLEKVFPDWSLTIVGDGPERKNIEKRIAEYKLKRVSLEGFKSPLEYYKRASILLLASEFEGFPLVLAECMNFGVIPAVYGSFSAVYDIIENNKDGIICDYNKNGFPTQTMADKLSEIMLDVNKRNNMALNAIKKSKNYSIDNIYKSWEKLLNSLK